jgi:hypothetical protein
MSTIHPSLSAALRVWGGYDLGDKVKVGSARQAVDALSEHLGSEPLGFRTIDSNTYVSVVWLVDGREQACAYFYVTFQAVRMLLPGWLPPEPGSDWSWRAFADFQDRTALRRPSVATHECPCSPGMAIPASVAECPYCGSPLPGSDETTCKGYGPAPAWFLEGRHDYDQDPTAGDPDLADGAW